MNDAASERRRLRWLEIFATAYLLVGGGRVLYECIQTRGLYGWLADQQMHRLGEFNFKMTMLGAGFIYLFPVSLVFSYIRRTRARLTLAGVIAPKVNDAMREAVNTARVFVLVGLGLALAGGIGYYVLAWQNEVNARETVKQLPLSALESLAAADAAKLKFIGVNATCQTRAGYRWTEEDRQSSVPEIHHRCLPLTGPDWRPGQPVHVFLTTTVDGYYPPDDSGLPFEMRSFEGASFTGAFEGELKGAALPAFVHNALQRAGVAIATPYYVLEHQTTGGKPRVTSRQEMLLPVILGGGLGSIFLLGGALMYWGRKGYAARIAARRGWPVPDDRRREPETRRRPVL